MLAERRVTERAPRRDNRTICERDRHIRGTEFLF
jgi:hypothetical protein